MILRLLLLVAVATVANGDVLVGTIYYPTFPLRNCATGTNLAMGMNTYPNLTCGMRCSIAHAISVFVMFAVRHFSGIDPTFCYNISVGTYFTRACGNTYSTTAGSGYFTSREYASVTFARTPYLGVVTYSNAQCTVEVWGM